jgi:hypothetical protein
MNKPKPRRGVAGLFTEVRGIEILRSCATRCNGGIMLRMERFVPPVLCAGGHA